MKLVIFAALAILVSNAHALSIEDAASAAKAAGFEDKAFPKAGESYSTTKMKSKKNFNTFKTYTKSKTSSAIEQISLSCNQCEAKKISEANSILCYQDVQAIATSLKIDLPGGVIKSFEDVKSQQQSWDIKDKRTKSLRFTKTQVACEKSKDEGIRFDFFFR
jgi:hypothetical protein